MLRLNDFVIGEELGKGTYGSVYECTDRNNKKKAIKCIPMRGKYKNIIEASIMATYRHPNIAASENIFIENDKLYIVQKLAINDLAVLTRGNPLPLNKVREYTYAITKAIYFLHARKVVHGDVKANNVLLYKNHSIKLTDFSLSTVMLKKYYNHGIGTNSHRPPECFNKEKWSYPVDIWSLGCTIYEMAYGCNIFPRQKEYDCFDSIDMLWLTILDWINTNEKIKVNTTIGGKKIVLSSLPIKRVKYTQRYYKKEYVQLNKLILSLMRYNPKNRLTPKEILEHPFFTGVSIPDNLKIIKGHKKQEISAKDIMVLDRYKVVEPQRTISLGILSICYDIPNMSFSELCRSCIFISYIITKTMIPNSFKDVLPDHILDYLGYSFHEIATCV